MNCKPFIPVDCESMADPVLACPVCGFYYVHPVGFECRSPGTAKGHLRVDSKGIHLNPEIPPLGRGVMIKLQFNCECGHAFEYEFQFSKGNTLVTRQTSQLPADHTLHLKTIWRD